MSEPQAPPEPAAPPPGHPLDDDTPLGAGLDFADPDSPLAPFYLRASHVVAATLLALTFWFYGQVVLHHTDVWGHLGFGRWIVEHGQLPAREPFSPFADQSQEYVHFQWLTQAGGYTLYRMGGWLAGGHEIQQMEGGVGMLRMAHALLTVLRYFLLLWAFCRICGSMPLALGGVGFTVVATLAPAAIQRPQVVGELFFALLLLALSRPLLSRWALAGLPLLFILWANAHGSYSIGLFLLGLFLLGRGIEAGWHDGQFRRLAAVLALSVAGIALLNPHGPRLFLHTLALGGNPNIPTLTEWQPLDFRLAPGGHWVYAIALALLIAGQALARKPLSPTRLLLVITFGVWACVQQRMMVWWLMLVPWIILPAWAEVIERLPWQWVRFETVPSFRKTLLAALIVAVILLWSRPLQWLMGGRPAPLVYSVHAATPWEVTAQLQAPTAGRSDWLPQLGEALKKHRYPDERFTGRIYATETLGDYLVWALPQDMPPLVYTHAHLFPRQHWLDCLAVKSGQPWWGEVLDRHRVNLVVIEPGLAPGLADRLRQDPAWDVVLDESSGTWTSQSRWERLLVALRKEPILPAAQ